MGRIGVLSVGLLLIACGSEPGGRPGAAGTAGGKADDSNGFDPSLSPHYNAVAACLVNAAKERAGDQLQAEENLRACVGNANNEVWSLVQRSIPARLPNEYTGELDPVEGDEVDVLAQRLRASQMLVCEVFAGVLGGDDDREQALVEARCLSEAEVHTANLIDAHFELGFPRLQLSPNDRRFERCNARLEDAIAGGWTPPEEAIPSEHDDTPLTEEAWRVSVHHHHRDCMKGQDAELRVAWADDLADREAYVDQDFRRRLRFVTGSFERESRASRRMCEFFAYATEDEPLLATALCMSDSTAQAGTLIDVLTSEPEVDEGSTGEAPDATGEPPPPRDPPVDPPVDPPPSGDDEACYPGVTGDYTTCLPLVYPASVIDGYDYPAPLNGSANYRGPIGFIDLDAVDPKSQLSRDFTLSEVAHRWKGRYAVVQPHAIASLQALRDEVGSITVNSGYRSPEYNRGVGGATHSRHKYGDGFDMDPNDVSLSTLENACQNNGGFLVEYTSHVHCDFRFSAMDESFFGKAP